MSSGTQKSAKIPLPVAKMIWSFGSISYYFYELSSAVVSPYSSGFYSSNYMNHQALVIFDTELSPHDLFTF